MSSLTLVSNEEFLNFDIDTMVAVSSGSGSVFSVCSAPGSPVAFSRSPSKVSEYDELCLSGTFSCKTK